MAGAAPGDSLLVAGGGPVGLLAALLLARRGWRATVLERRPDPRQARPERGRSINLALAARGLAALRAAGLLEAAAPELVPMRGRLVHEMGGGTAFQPYGQRADEVVHAVSRARLTLLLVEAAARERSIELRFGARVTGVDAAAGCVEWTDAAGTAQRSHARLVLGADGAGSALRGALAAGGALRADESPLAHDYRELEMPAAADGGWALEPHALHIWPRRGHMLIALPNPDRSFTATVFLPATGAGSFAALAAPESAREWFQAQYADALGLLPDFERQWAGHPQGRLATLHCRPWHAGRVLLVGDAAHAIVPFHGQGLNCGFEDCVQLARLLDAGVAPEALPARFEAARREDAEAIAELSLENYGEMREQVLDPQFHARHALGLALERRFPEAFVPRYAMVMFHPEIGYAEARRRGLAQERLLGQLLAAGAGADSALAARLVGELSAPE